MAAEQCKNHADAGQELHIMGTDSPKNDHVTLFFNIQLSRWQKMTPHSKDENLGNYFAHCLVVKAR